MTECFSYSIIYIKIFQAIFLKIYGLGISISKIIYGEYR